MKQRNSLHPRHGASLGALSLLFLAGSCGSDAIKKAAQDLTSYMSYLADGFAVSSPTAKSSSSTLQAQSSEYRAMAVLTSEATISEKAEIVKELAEGKSAAGCSFTLPNLGQLGARANCYGPSVDYTGHPDGSAPSGSLPGGDLGIWNYAEAGSGEACAVAQLNKLSSSASAYVDASLLLQAASICSLDAAGKTLPDVGSEAVYTTELSASLAGPTGATITSATVKRTAESVAEFIIEGTTNGSSMFKTTIRHTVGSSETEYTGIIFGSFVTAAKDAFSVEYSRSGSALKARLVAGSWATSTADATIFDSTSSRVNAGGTFQGNMNHAILNFDTTAKTGTISYAWQAGSGDSNTRVFNAYVSGTAGSRTGCGFFGYGAKFSTDFASNTNAISGMICNWAGPGNNHVTHLQSSKAQKQCFTESSGKFVQETPKNAILYWPTNSCDKGSISVTPSQEGETGTANALATLSSDTDFAVYAAPAAP